MLKDRGNDQGDADRFAEFLRREAADYHAPPETPAEAIWARIEARLGTAPVSGSPETADTATGLAGVVDHPFDVLGYNDPPPAPREAMWEQIEAEWIAGQQEAPLARETTRGPLRFVVARTFGRRPGRTAAWLTGAAAASVALAVALDGGSELPLPSEAETVAMRAASGVTSAPASVAATDSGPLAPTAAEEALALSSVEEPLEMSRQFAAAEPPAAADPAPPPGRPGAGPPAREAVTSPSQRPVGLPAAARPTADEHDMSRHLDRAAALLVAFRTDIGSDESQRDLARWAREFLVETRSLLDTPAAEGQRERALLQDLELILVQIARLGPDAPEFERELARESVEQQGTLLRLRYASGT